jgi:hypothetical protein
VLSLTLGDNHRVEEQLSVVFKLNFWVDLAFNELGWEVSEIQGCIQAVSNRLKVVLGREGHLINYTFIIMKKEAKKSAEKRE